MMETGKKFIKTAHHGLLAVLLIFSAASNADAASRIKDIVEFEGVRENQLVGYGLVVGLNNTGDTLKTGHFTKQSLQAMLNRMGVKPTDSGLDSKNVAAVMVTAVLPPFARQGSHIDITVSALGDSSSLLGGTLLVTPLLGADGEVYAVGQGQLAVGGFAAKGNAETVTKGVPTSGRIANGGIVEREIPRRDPEMMACAVGFRRDPMGVEHGQRLAAIAVEHAAAKLRDTGIEGDDPRARGILPLHPYIGIAVDLRRPRKNRWRIAVGHAPVIAQCFAVAAGFGFVLQRAGIAKRIRVHEARMGVVELDIDQRLVMAFD